MAEANLFSGLGGIAGGLFSTALLVVYAIIFSGLLILAIKFIQTVQRYNVHVEVVEKVGDSEITKYDKGWIRKVQGVPKLRLKGYKRDEAIPRADLFTPLKTRFGWGKIIRFYKVGETFTPLGVTTNSPTSLVPFIDSDVELWFSLENQRAYETYNKKSFLDVYGTYVAVGGLFVLVFIMGIIFFEQFGTIAQSFQAAASELAAARVQQIPPG